ncbi:SET domain-containing protein SmydA-8 [Lepeophtheirus salmonis]|nr:SET domain-containing protein SmydA-8-like [Lepeophtheirus salmonis]
MEENNHPEGHFRIQENERDGRHLVSTCDLMPGDVIFFEKPIAFSPSSSEDDACIVCLKRLGTEDSVCSGCWWPLCSFDCGQSTIHKAECQSLAACVGRPDDEMLPFQHLLVLRCLLLRLNDKEAWEKLLSLEDHHGIQTLIQSDQEEESDSSLNELLLFIRDDCGIGNVMDDETIETVFDIVRSCLIHVKCDEPIVKKFPALYLTAGLISHSCFENTRLVFHPDNFGVSVIACLPIKAGTKLTRCYLQKDVIFLGTEERRTFLEDYLIDCYCIRCMDSTECGSFSSAILCPTCDKLNSPVLSSNPLDEDTEWQCAVCSSTFSSDFVRSLCLSSKDQLENAYQTPELRNFLISNQFVLHPHHFLMISCKAKIFHCLGRENESSTIGDLIEKVKLGKELMAVAEILIPGITVSRGKLLLKLGNAFQLLVSRELMNRIECREELGLSEKQVFNTFFDSNYCYQEVLHILSSDMRKSARIVEKNVKEALNTLEQMRIDFENSL